MDGAALVSMDVPGCGVWRPTNGKLMARGGGEGGDPAGQHPCGNNRGPGWRELAGTFGCPLGGSGTDVAVRQEVEGLAIERGRD